MSNAGEAKRNLAQLIVTERLARANVTDLLVERGVLPWPDSGGMFTDDEERIWMVEPKEIFELRRRILTAADGRLRYGFYTHWEEIRVVGPSKFSKCVPVPILYCVFQEGRGAAYVGISKLGLGRLLKGNGHGVRRAMRHTSFEINEENACVMVFRPTFLHHLGEAEYMVQQKLRPFLNLKFADKTKRNLL